MRPAPRFLAAVLLLGTASCAQLGPSTPRPAHVFVVPADSLAPRYTRVAIVPVRSMRSLVVPVLEAPLEARLAAAWRNAGYEVVGAGDGERLWISAVRRGRWPSAGRRSAPIVVPTHWRYSTAPSTPA